MKTIYENSTDTAKKIRARLKKEFPKLPKSHFKVRTSTYSGGSSITVYWEDFPYEKDVSEIINQYKSASFDGMIDLETRHGYVDPEDGLLYSGAGYIFTSYQLSDKRLERIIEIINETYSDGYDPSDYIRGNKRVQEVNKMLDINNEFLPEYKKLEISIEDRDFEKDKKEFIEYYLDNFPSEFLGLGAGSYLLGKVVPENPLKPIKVTNDYGFRGVFKETFTQHLDIEDLKFDYTHSNNIKEYKDSMYYRFSVIYKDHLKDNVIKNVLNHVKKYYKQLAKQLITEFSKRVPLDKNFKEEYAKRAGLTNPEFNSQYFNIFKEIDLDIFWGYSEDVSPVFKRHLENIIKEIYKEQNDPRNVDKVIVANVTKQYAEMAPELQHRISRIVLKNDGEVKKMILESKYVMDKEHLILKYVTDKGIIFYQTHYSLWAYHQADDKGNKANLQLIYKLGNEPIKECMQKALAVQTYYTLPEISVHLAQKMYLR